MLPAVSIVLPCHNEEACLEGVVRDACGAGRELALDWEVVVVDDGSSDWSPELLRALQRDEPRIQVVTHERNRGYGAALRSGFARAVHPWIFYLDADGQYDPFDLRNHLALVSSETMVIGFRAPRRDGLIRLLNGSLWTALTNAMLGLRVRDVDCGFKVFPRALLEGDALRADGATVDAELLSLARHRGLTIHEVPVQHLPRRGGRASGARPEVVMRALFELAKLVLARPQERARAVQLTS